MKFRSLALAALMVAAGTSWAAAQQQPPAQNTLPAAGDLQSEQQKASYVIGLDFAENLKRASQQYQLDNVSLMKGLNDGLSNQPKIKQEEFQAIMAAYLQGLAAKARKTGDDFLAANKGQPGVTTLPSGLQFKVLRKGTGKSPKADDRVSVHYKGTLIDGTEFDSSYKGNQPVDLGVTEVIAGWTEALQLMKEGDKWQLFVPTDLAYGGRPPGESIPSFAALVFEVELLKVLDKAAAPATPQP